MRGDAALAIGVDRDRCAHVKRRLGKAGLGRSFLIRHRDGTFRPLEVVGRIPLRAFRWVRVIQADCVVARRNVRRQIVQQIAAQGIGTGIVVERAGKRTQWIATIAEAGNARLGCRLVVGFSHIHRFRVSCAIARLRCHDAKCYARDDLAAQRHACKMYDTDVIVGVLVIC